MSSVGVYNAMDNWRWMCKRTLCVVECCEYDVGECDVLGVGKLSKDVGMVICKSIAV